VVQADGEAAADFWRSAPGVLGVACRSATLEELFVACTRGDSLYKRQASRSLPVSSKDMEASPS
jgi:hypothetical protein